MNIRPVYNHIIAKKYVYEAKSAGGIILTANQEEDSTHAEVIAVGPSFLSDVKVGDIVTYAEGDKRVHSEKIDNENILIMPEDCILGVIEQDKGE
jgi:chaperonin GroES